MSRLNYDQTSDFSGAEIFSFLKEASHVPSYVQSAPVDDFSTLEGLPKEAFADSGRRTYPINTPARTYVSNVYFINKKAGLLNLHGENYVSKLEGKIKEAADIFGISDDLTSYASEFNVKEASDYSQKYVSSMELPGADCEIDLFPYKTASDLSDAAEQFASNTSSFPIEDRFKIAEDFVKAAKEMGVDELPILISKYAGMYFSTPELVRNELSRRAPRLKTAESKELYTKTLSDLADDISSIEDVNKIAATCFYTEKNQGLWDNNKTASFLGDPVDKFFNISIEKAAEITDVVKVAGKNYSIPDLQKISQETFQEALGVQIDPLNKEALYEVMPTVPRSDMALLCELSGLKPI